MKFYIETFGCKVNMYESNYIKQSLLKSGFVFSEDIKRADIIIINTCTVTNTADNKCFKFVRRVRRENPNSLLVVMGCSTQNNYEKYAKLDIDILIGNKGKYLVPQLILDYQKNPNKYSFWDNNRNLDFENMELEDFDHTRAFVKIQDGCDNFCSYCIIPFVRGKSRCKKFSLIMEEVNKIVANGHKEVVLTGINTGSYYDDGKDLVDLINELSKIEDLKRIRLSSVEITELNEKFMQMLKSNTKFCDHLHIPLQAGSNKILKAMNRKYDLEYFFAKIKEIRKIRPLISITTDIIVGFPTETEDMFNQTYENASKLEFSKIHVFPYSKRNSTVASRLSEVNSTEKTNRVHKLLELSKRLEYEYKKKFDNQKVNVLVEEIKDGISIGHTSNYLKVEIPEVLEQNEFYDVIFKA